MARPIEPLPILRGEVARRFEADAPRNYELILTGLKRKTNHP